jgi:hypothetical protein
MMMLPTSVSASMTTKPGPSTAKNRPIPAVDETPALKAAYG